MQLHQRKIEQLVAQNQQLTTAKKAAYPQLTACVSYITGAKDTVTTRYFYSSASRGARFDYNMMRYENFYDPATNSSFNDVPFRGHYLQPKPYILYDSLRTTRLYPPKTFSIRIIYTPQDDISEYWHTYGDRTIHLYNSQNQLYRLININWNNTIARWDTMAVKNIYYNTLNQVSRDTLFVYNQLGYKKLSKVTSYSYDVNGNIVLVEVFWDRMENGVLLPWEKYICKYDSKNRLTNVDQFETSLDTGYNLKILRTKDTFGYASNTPFHTYWRTTHLSYLGNWQESRLVTKHLNAQGLPDSIFGMTGSADKQVFIYNSDGHPIESRKIMSPAVIQITYYYYTPSLGIPKVPPLQEQITLYPNPANNQLNLSWVDFQAGTTGVEIINTTGQVVLRDELSWQQSNQLLSIAGLQPGVYWVTLTDAQGNAIFRQAVVKQ